LEVGASASLLYASGGAGDEGSVGAQAVCVRGNATTEIGTCCARHGTIRESVLTSIEGRGGYRSSSAEKGDGKSGETHFVV